MMGLDLILLRYSHGHHTLALFDQCIHLITLLHELLMVETADVSLWLLSIMLLLALDK